MGEVGNSECFHRLSFGIGVAVMKPLEWVGASLDDLRALPKEVRQEAGFSIHLAQTGGRALNAVPMVGFGSAKVLEVLMPSRGNTYRAVYTVKFKLAVYVLHVFQKKSKTGKKTPATDIALIKRNLKIAERHYTQNYEGAIAREAEK